MTNEEARRRAAALLRLAERAGTPDEAAAAAGKAQEVMTRYQLDAVGLLDDGPEDDPGPMISTGRGGDPVADLGRRMPAWKWSLAWQLSKVNGCVPFTRQGHAGKVLHLVGRAGDVDTVRYLFPLIVRQVEWAAEGACRGMGAVYGRNFREGAVERIGERLRQAVEDARRSFQADAAARGVALVRVNQALATIGERHQAAMRASMAMEGLRWRTTRRYAARDGSARAAGREAADRMTIGGRAAGGLPGGQRRLPL
jgi:hypothetical protein